MAKQDQRIKWVISEFETAHRLNTDDAWADVRHMVYAASQALLWHDDTDEAKQDRDAYQFLGSICFANECEAIDAQYKEAA
jgi:hypothetical protein